MMYFDYEQQAWKLNPGPQRVARVLYTTVRILFEITCFLILFKIGMYAMIWSASL